MTKLIVKILLKINSMNNHQCETQEQPEQNLNFPYKKSITNGDTNDN